MPRIALRFLAALCVMCVAAAALGQDPRTIAVQSAARAWLEFVDRGDAQGAWNAAGKKFRAALSLEAWSQQLASEQTQDGKPFQRTVGPTRFQNQIPSMEEGEYAQILFRTVFAKKPAGRESVTLEREVDGRWRVIGYFPRGS